MAFTMLRSVHSMTIFWKVLIINECGSWGAWRDKDCLHCSSYGPMSSFLPAACRRSEASLASLPPQFLPQARRGLPCPGPFSVVQYIGHIEGAPGWDPALDLRVSHLKECPGWVLLRSSVRQAFDGPASLLFSCRCWHVGRESLWWWCHPLRLSSIALLPWLPGFPPQAFRTTVFSLTTRWSISSQSTAALAMGLCHNP